LIRNDKVYLDIGISEDMDRYYKEKMKKYYTTNKVEYKLIPIIF